MASSTVSGDWTEQYAGSQVDLSHLNLVFDDEFNAPSVGVANASTDTADWFAPVHSTFGSQGGPGALFLAYLANSDPHAHLLVRVGLVELPLVHSPAQRLDDINAYGYEALLALPALWMLASRPGSVRIGALVAAYCIAPFYYYARPLRFDVLAVPVLGGFGCWLITRLRSVLARGVL